MPAQLSYNGIVLDITRIRSSRKVMMEGPNYLYTRHIIHCKAYYNRAATAYVRAKNGPKPVMADLNQYPDSFTLLAFLHNPPRGTPSPDEASNPRIDPNRRVPVARDFDIADAPTTDVAIRHYLSLPRKKLIHIVGNTPVLVSSWARDPAMTVDVNNGPVVLYHDVLAQHGSKTFEVEFVVQTDVNERRMYQTLKVIEETPPPSTSPRLSTSIGSEFGASVQGALGQIPNIGAIAAAAADLKKQEEDDLERKEWQSQPVKTADGSNVDQLILSNIYGQEDELNEHFFLTRTTHGRAILNTSVLQALDLNILRAQPVLRAGVGAAGDQGSNFSGDPDIIRRGITQLVPVPRSCKRENFRFGVDEHNNSIVYSFVDVERPFNIVASAYPNITDVKVTQTRFNQRSDELQVLTSRIMAAMEGGYRGSGMGAIPIVGAAIGGVVGAGLGWGIAALFPQNLPRLGTALVIDIWGNMRCTKNEMLSAAKNIITTQVNRSKGILGKIIDAAGGFQRFLDSVSGPIADVIGKIGLPGFNPGKALVQQGVNTFVDFLGIKNLTFTGRVRVDTTFDLTGKHLTMICDYQQSILGAVLNKLDSKTFALIPSDTVFGEGDQNNQGQSAVYTEADVTNPQPPGDGLSRGMVLDFLSVRHPWAYDREHDPAFQPELIVKVKK